MKIKKRNINDLLFADYNPRKLTKKEYFDIKESILKFGLVDPIIVNKNKDRDDIIIGGHQRLRICRELGYKTVPTIEMDLELKLEKELNVRLNKNTGSWDFDIMGNYYDLSDLKSYGFEDKDLFFKIDDLDDVKPNNEICECCGKVK